MEDKIVRQLEQFIEKKGTIPELKKLLSTCADDEEFLIRIRNFNLH